MDNRRRKKKIYSTGLGIDLKSRRESELFKWFLACLLFGKPIQREVAKRAYFELKKVGIITPKAILKAGWSRLVKVLDRGHYARYDESTATKLLEISRELKSRYGSISALIKAAKNRRDLEFRLIEFKGIGPVTARIFLRDLIPHFLKLRK